MMLNRTNAVTKNHEISLMKNHSSHLAGILLGLTLTAIQSLAQSF